MLMSQFLKSRKTVRDYKRKAIPRKTVREIRSILEEANKKMADKGATLVFLQDGKDILNVLEGKGGYAGVMIESPSYIALNIVEEKEEAYIFGAYYLEDTITKLYDYNLGSCWISLGNVEEPIRENLTMEDGRTEYLLSIGYPVPQMGIGEAPYSSRLGVEEIVFTEEGKKVTMEELEQRGLDDLFYYIRFAPSAYNRQPWRFYLGDGKITMTIPNYSDKVTLVDAGIMMYYFEKMIAGIGIAQKFQVDVKDVGADKQIGSIQV